VKSKLAKTILLLIIGIMIISLISCYSQSATPTTPAATTRTITDMYGRQLTVPIVINRVLTTGPIEMELVYLIAPDKLAGLSFTFNGEPPLVPEKYSSLPVVGGWFGTKTGNYETFIAAEPDIILEGTEANIEERQEKFGGIPVVGVHAGDNLTDYADDALTGYEDEIRFLGELLGAQQNAESLITYYRDAMQYVQSVVSKIPDNAMVKVYYAEGKDGLSTDPTGSMHTRLLEFCGGKNVAQVTLKPGYGMAETSLEQIILWDPDMIIIGRGSQITLYQTIMTDDKWSQLRAVENKQVFLRPDNPFPWFDGPPGPCQIVGMYWMVNKLYPEETTDLDLKAKVKEFYTKFFHYNLTDEELAKLLANPS
jgi:iron complex transport system substrate-binding protein